MLYNKGVSPFTFDRARRVRFDAGVEAYGQTIDERRPSWTQGAISGRDIKMLCHAVRRYKPERVLEVGVASGWSTCALLWMLLGREESERLVSIDRIDHVYFDSSRPVGDAVNELHDLANVRARLDFELLGNCDLPAYQQAHPEERFDMIFIDANHAHPYCVMDMLVALKMLARPGIILLHDICLSQLGGGRYPGMWGPHHCFNYWSGTKFLADVSEPNMGLVEVLPGNEENDFADLMRALAQPFDIEAPTRDLERSLQWVQENWGADYAEWMRRTLVPHLSAPDLKAASA